MTDRYGAVSSSGRTRANTIIHVDMDAFYAAVEQRDNPALLGKPVIVGGAPDRRGVVAAASYEAREFGVFSAMPAATARRLCPHAIFLQPRFAYYNEVSHGLRRIFERYTPIIEPLSLDEAFLDIEASRRLMGDAETIGRKIKYAIRTELGLVASVGVAPNKFLAKLASDCDKPDGFVVVDPTRPDTFLDPLPVQRIWGIGRVAQQRLRQLGVHTVADLKAAPVDALRDKLGKTADHLCRLAAGVDNRAVVPDHRTRSISQETTFNEDIDQPAVLKAILATLVDHVAARLRHTRRVGRIVQIKVRHGDFTTRSRARTLDIPTNKSTPLWRAACAIFAAYRKEFPGAIRLLGFGVTGLNAAIIQTDLFTTPDSETRSIDALADKINTRFGAHTLRRGVTLYRRQTKAFK